MQLSLLFEIEGKKGENFRSENRKLIYMGLPALPLPRKTSSWYKAPLPPGFLGGLGGKVCSIDLFGESFLPMVYHQTKLWKSVNTTAYIISIIEMMMVMMMMMMMMMMTMMMISLVSTTADYADRIG